MKSLLFIGFKSRAARRSTIIKGEARRRMPRTAAVTTIHNAFFTWQVPPPSPVHLLNGCPSSSASFCPSPTLEICQSCIIITYGHHQRGTMALPRETTGHEARRAAPGTSFVSRRRSASSCRRRPARTPTSIVVINSILECFFLLLLLLLLDDRDVIVQEESSSSRARFSSSSTTRTPVPIMLSTSSTRTATSIVHLLLLTLHECIGPIVVVITEKPSPFAPHRR